MIYARDESMDVPGLLTFVNSEDMYNLRMVRLSKEAWEDLGNIRNISVIDPVRETPESWYSVYKSLGEGRWALIAMVDTLQTAQTLLNTMETGKIKNGDVQIEVKNSHLNEKTQGED